MMTIVSTVGAAICYLLNFIVDNDDLKTVLSIAGSALIGGLLVARLIKASFGYKSTLAEIEDSQLGKENNNSNITQNAD